MKLYSNKLLTWPSALHLRSISHIYYGKWLDYNIYKIQNINPLIINTYSPINKLHMDNTYYCYDKYEYNRSLDSTNKNHIAHLYNDIYTYTVPKIKLPNNIEGGDIIVIHESPEYTGNAPLQLA
jgi:hypothetical protein